MSAFNNARFDLSRFDVRSEETLWFADNFAEKVDSLISTSATSFTISGGNENVAFSGSRPAEGRLTSANGSEGVVQATATAQMNFKIGMTENVSIDELVISANFFNQNHFIEDVACDSYISADNWFYPDFDEIVDIERDPEGEEEHFCIGQEFFEECDGTENVDGNADAISLTEYICDFPGLSLKPNDVLIVDASNYNILLNKQNAIYLQSNEWLDELNRSTQSIKITADRPSNLVATILYTERYL